MTKNTKQSKILAVLKSGQPLNRFQAELLGDHVLPCTISALRDKGHLIIGQWEEVPTRFGKTVRVKQYSFVGYI